MAALGTRKLGKRDTKRRRPKVEKPAAEPVVVLGMSPVAGMRPCSLPLSGPIMREGFVTETAVTLSGVSFVVVPPR